MCSSSTVCVSKIGQAVVAAHYYACPEVRADYTVAHVGRNILRKGDPIGVNLLTMAKLSSEQFNDAK